jgi:hypothetical protein
MMMFKEVVLPKPSITDRKVLAWNQNQPEYKDLSSKEQQFYYWVNYSRINPSRFFDSVVVPIVKIYPQLNGANYSSLKQDLEQTPVLPPLALSHSLLRMSDFHAVSITTNDASPSHVSYNGETFDIRFKRFGLNNCGGENISYGAAQTDPLFMLVLLYLDVNVTDLGHRKALLNPSFVTTGIAAANYKNGNVFLVEDFACAQK